jgi:ureidoglycolate hydrolase
MRILDVLDLTAEAFAPYGEVFASAGVTARVDQIAALQNKRAWAKPNLFMARTNLASLPHRFDKMESHPHSSQSFLRLDIAPMLVAVARPGRDGKPDLATLRAFLGHSTGFSYRAGIWHLPITSLGDTVPVAGFMYEDGSPEDCVWATVEPVSLAQG